MCGIVGYKGTNNATEVVIEGLRRLEYRGYDSWGIASINLDHIDLLRREGKIGQVSIKNVGNSSGISIGHTRWATHGGVCEANAHPHVSFDKRVAVVHNGIVENYQELRKELELNKIKLLSQTDTEVIPHLIALAVSPTVSFAEAVRRVCLRLKGSYAIVAVHQDFDEIIVARDGSPAVIGVHQDEAEKEFFVASDVTAFLEHTKEVVYLRDGDMGIINSQLNVMRIADGAPVNYRLETIPWSIEEARKGEFHHFMIKEIYEQAESTARALSQEDSSFGTAIKYLKNGKQVFLVACGTSGYACLNGQSWFRSLAQKDVQVVLGSEFESVASCVSKDDVVVAISQSGETIDTILAVRAAKAKNAKVVAIVNVVGSSLSRIADVVLQIKSGPEICVVATKSYLNTLVILARLAGAVGEIDVEEIESVPSLIKETIDSTQSAISELSTRIAHAKDVFVIGRGLLHPTALEAALKLKETCYVHAEGFAGGELKHGSITLIETGVPLIAFCDDKTRSLIVSNAMEVRARGGWVIGVDSKPNEAYDAFIKVPDAGALQPIVSIIPLQLLSYYAAVHKGLDPDKPRNLAKSVTVK